MPTKQERATGAVRTGSVHAACTSTEIIHVVWQYWPGGYRVFLRNCGLLIFNCCEHDHGNLNSDNTIHGEIRDALEELLDTSDDATCTLRELHVCLSQRGDYGKMHVPAHRQRMTGFQFPCTGGRYFDAWICYAKSCRTQKTRVLDSSLLDARTPSYLAALLISITYPYLEMTRYTRI
jgi:hypothetical protein